MPKPINGCSTLRRGPMRKRASGRVWKTPAKAEFGRRDSSSKISKLLMSYSVSFTVRAQRDPAILFEIIHADDSAAAGKWYRGLKHAILRLEDSPNRCPQTAESQKLRHLLYGRKPHVYRVIFRVIEKDKRVEVLHIRHGARRRVRPTDLK